MSPFRAPVVRKRTRWKRVVGIPTSDGEVADPLNLLETALLS